MNMPANVQPEGAAAQNAPVPLVIDLDGTLLRSDLLVEAIFAFIGRHPTAILKLIAAFFRGRAGLKDFLAQTIEVDPAILPYDEAVLEHIRRARAEGQPTLLVSASHETYVEAVARHLGLFDEHIGSNATRNLKGRDKAKLLVEKFGQRAFDYVGDSAADLRIWECARGCVSIRSSAGTARRLRKIAPDALFLTSEKPTLRTWAKMLRVHQWAKNGLIAVPMLTAHKFDPASLLAVVLAFLAFSFCASSVYIINDQIDLADDRTHPTKRRRPLASGALSLHAASAVAVLLFASSMALGALVSLQFLAVLLGYFALTSAYSVWLKRKMLVDVVVLAMLYTIRVIAGAVAIDVVVSQWLLAFSMFIFLSLALIKRYVDLAGRLDEGRSDPSNRNYKIGDLEVVGALAAAAGFNAVTVLALWISSPAVQDVYRRPQMLWLACPLLLYWISRALMMAHRRFMDDDPIVFALKDKNSLIAGAGIGLLVLLAI